MLILHLLLLVLGLLHCLEKLFSLRVPQLAQTMIWAIAVICARHFFNLLHLLMHKLASCVIYLVLDGVFGPRAQFHHRCCCLRSLLRYGPTEGPPMLATRHRSILLVYWVPLGREIGLRVQKLLEGNRRLHGTFIWLLCDTKECRLSFSLVHLRLTHVGAASLSDSIGTRRSPPAF